MQSSETVSNIYLFLVLCTVATFIRLTSLKRFGENFQHNVSKPEGSATSGALDLSNHSQRLSASSDNAVGVVGAFTRRISRVACAPNDQPPLSRQTSGVKGEQILADSSWEQQPPGGYIDRDREKHFSNPRGSSTRNIQIPELVRHGAGERSPQTMQVHDSAASTARSQKRQDMKVEEFEMADVALPGIDLLAPLCTDSTPSKLCRPPVRRGGLPGRLSSEATAGSLTTQRVWSPPVRT